MANFPRLINSQETFDDSDDELDPRIKIELDSLNQAACDVNRLEKEINEARHKYQETFSECSQQLELLRKRYGAKVNKARPYYEIKEASKEAQSEALLSARKFQSANGVYLAAKETISLAELRLKDDKAASLSPAWQEMLNHALIRVMESEQEKTKSEKEHLERAAVFAEKEKKLHILEKKHKKAIAKAKPYFDSKNELELKLQQIKQSIEDLQQAMHSAKSRYSQSLKNLEAISDGIHEARRQKLILMYPREPGVGAEEEPDSHLQELPSLPSSNTDLELSRHLKGVDQLVYSDSEEEDLTSLDEEVMKVDYTGSDRLSSQKMRSFGAGEETVSKLCDFPSNTDSELSRDLKADGQVNSDSEEVLTSCNKEITTNAAANKSTKQKLKLSTSLPSYVMGETLQLETRTLEIETDNVLLKLESGTISVESDSENVENINNKSKKQQQILDPSALCVRDIVVVGGDII